MISSDIQDFCLPTEEQIKAWPFEEARKIFDRYKESSFPRSVVFETGYGPSGLPHIGTFSEVARTSMVQHAFRLLTRNQVKTRMICFSDDMDGFRKIPENIPNRDQMVQYLGKPLTQVPDPFFESNLSFGDANNARLCAFLDQFNFEYEFASSTYYYKSGRFDETLLKMLFAYDRIVEIILPTLGKDRRKTYSPFLPISPFSGKVLQVPILTKNIKKGTITYIEPETGEKIESTVTGGNVKCQWKADWALRWVALGIDYEMAGKDLVSSVNLSGKICQILDGNPPEGFNYELFLDDRGRKISKSKGNGLTVKEWLYYAPAESLSLYMYKKPKTAKRLFFDVIPKTVDDYYSLLKKYRKQGWKERFANPVWHIHHGRPPEIDLPISFSMLLNLVSASNADNRNILWGFISRYVPGVTAESHPMLDLLVLYAIRYFQDFVRPYKKYRAPDYEERKILSAIEKKLALLEPEADEFVIQNALLDVARTAKRYQDSQKSNKKENPGVSGTFFQMLYEVLIGQTCGPRFGTFIALYGLSKTRQRIIDILNE